jgi:DNA-binding NtrC family response regulator
MKIPPLRERADDVPLLVEHFLRECGHDRPVEELISPAAMKTLMIHHWPGNVRELRNLIEATVAMGETPALEGGGGGAGAAAGDVSLLPYKEARAQVLADFEARYLRALLERARNNVSQAAREARMDRSHLIDLLTRHGLKPGS